MILVKSIEIVEVPGDPWVILSGTQPYEAIEVFNSKNELEFISTNTFRELIKGQRFIRPDGKELLIGCSKQAEGVIGIQYDSWNSLTKLLDATRKELYAEKGRAIKAETELVAIQQLGFFKRLIALFRGY